MGTLGEYIWEKYVPSVLKGPKGGGLFAVACLVADFCADMLLRAAHSGLIASPLSPDDVLPKVGKERGGLVKYPTETWDQYRARLLNAPVSWEYGGADRAVETELEAAGFTGARVVLDPTAIGPHGEPAPYPSQFWVEIPASSLTLVPPVWGQMVWGCFWWGTNAVERSQAELFWFIVNTFKDGNQVCRGIRLG